MQYYVYYIVATHDRHDDVKYYIFIMRLHHRAVGTYLVIFIYIFIGMYCEFVIRDTISASLNVQRYKNKSPNII